MQKTKRKYIQQKGRGAGRSRGSRDIGSRGRGSSAAVSTSPDLPTDLCWEDTDAAPQKHSFEGDPGVKATATDWSDPYAVFRIFLTSFLLQLVVHIFTSQCEICSGCMG